MMSLWWKFQDDKLPLELEDDLPGVETSLLNVPSKCAEQAEEFVKKVPDKQIKKKN